MNYGTRMRVTRITMNLVIEVLEQSAGVLRLRHREKSTRAIAKTYGPKVGTYIVQSGNVVLAAWAPMEDRVNAETARINEAVKPKHDSAEVPLPRGQWVSVTEGPRDEPRASLVARMDSLAADALGDIAPNLLRPTSLALARGLDAGGKRIIGEMKKLGLDLDAPFDVRNPEAVTWTAEQSATLVKRVNEQSRNILRTILTDGMREGKSYQKIAREIRERFKRDGTFSNKVPGPRHVRTRAELIAVTEIGNAYEEGSRQVVERLNKKVKMRKRWITVGDERVSDMDIANAAMGWIKFPGVFSSGHSRPLSHPGCRCVAIYRTLGRGR